MWKLCPVCRDCVARELARCDCGFRFEPTAPRPLVPPLNDPPPNDPSDGPAIDPPLPFCEDVPEALEAPTPPPGVLFPVVRFWPAESSPTGRPRLLHVTPERLRLLETWEPLSERLLQTGEPGPGHRSRVNDTRFDEVTSATVRRPSPGSDQLLFTVSNAAHPVRFLEPLAESAPLVAALRELLGPRLDVDPSLTAPRAPAPDPRPSGVDVPMVVLCLAVVLLTPLLGKWVGLAFGTLTLVGLVVYVLSTRFRLTAGQPALHNPVLGWVMKCLGVTALVCVVYAAETSTNPSWQGIKPPLSFVVGGLFVWLALVPMYLGYKLCQRTVFPFRHGADGRAPVVFLRAFDDDERTSLQPNTWAARFHGLTPPFALFEGTGWHRKVTQSALWPVHPIRLLKLLFNADRYYSEELLAGVFRGVGPFVAIGRPGELLPSPGAAKMYVGHDEWQGVVLDYLTRCRAVVIQPSKSPGIRWEVEQVLTRVPRERVLLCLSNFHNKPGDYEEFREWVHRQTGVHLPLIVPFLKQPSVVYFGADGAPLVQPVCYRSPVLWPFVVSGVDARRTFDGFVRGLQGEAPGKPVTPRRHFGHTVLSVAMVPLVFVGTVVALAFGDRIADRVAAWRGGTSGPTAAPIEYRGKSVGYVFQLSGDWKSQTPPADRPGEMPTEYAFGLGSDTSLRVRAEPGPIDDIDDIENLTKPTPDTTLVRSARVVRDGTQWLQLTYARRGPSGQRVTVQLLAHSGPDRGVLVVATGPDTDRVRAEIDRALDTFRLALPTPKP